MKEFEFKINNKIGMHARPAGVIAQESKKYNSEIIFKANGQVASGKRLLSLMALGAKSGDALSITIDGDDENEAEVALKSILEKVLG